MYSECKLCARLCGVNRAAGGIGYCKSGDKPRIARAALHMWEEPVISGERGSGTVFFSGCSLGCIYCQNREISRNAVGRCVSSEELSRIYLDLEAQGAHNINLVTPTHFVPTVIDSVAMSRSAGLKLPIVYNTASYETVNTVELLRNTVDVWLPDLKYYRGETAKKYSNAEDLPSVAMNAIEKMVQIAGAPIIDSSGIMTRGVIVRILLLPSHLAEAKLNVKRLYSAFGDSVYMSLMSQYTPSPNMPKPLDRRVTLAEYYELVSYAEKLGVTNAFIQEREAASESFIPPFNTDTQ